MLGLSFDQAPGVPESALHPHCSEERADEFSALDPGSPEVENLEFLHVLVRLFKPSLVLETGTGSGWSTFAIALALKRNDRGSIQTVELDASTAESARNHVGSLDPGLLNRVSFNIRDSLDFIDEWAGPPFDFAFFDSLIPIRHREFELAYSKGKLAPKALCVFHDTSRLRGMTMNDFDAAVLAALDRASSGRQWLECELSRGIRLLRLP